MKKLLCIGGVLLTFFFGQAVDSAWQAAQWVLTPNPRDAKYGYGSNKLFLIHQNNGYGYIDQSGKVVIPTRYDWASEFSEGVALVRSGSSTFFIDMNGDEVISSRLQPSESYSDGLALSYDRPLIKVRCCEGPCQFIGHGYIDKGD